MLRSEFLFCADVIIVLGCNRDFVSDVTVGLCCYFKVLVIPIERLDSLRDPILLPTLGVYEVLFAT